MSVSPPSPSLFFPIVMDDERRPKIGTIDILKKVEIPSERLR